MPLHRLGRNTIRHATNKLEYEGLLIRKKGVGTKVATKRPSEKNKKLKEDNSDGSYL